MHVTAIAQRSGAWWSVRVPDMAGIFTQARRLDQVPQMVIDAIRTMEEDDDLEVSVQVVPMIDPASDTVAAQARATSEQASRMQDEARAAARTAVRVLRAEGLSTRDVASMLGVSPQRVSQIAHASGE